MLLCPFSVQDHHHHGVARLSGTPSSVPNLQKEAAVEVVQASTVLGFDKLHIGSDSLLRNVRMSCIIYDISRFQKVRKYHILIVF